MSCHIDAKMGDIAETVFLPGDPNRVQYIAENFLKDVICYSKTRGALGYTGYYNNERISVQSTGMGIPSASIYISELINEYQAKTLIRLGTTGAAQKWINIRDIILPIAAATDSSFNHHIFEKFHYPPCADFNLLVKAQKIAEKMGVVTHVGPVLTTDFFYPEDSTSRERLFDYGILSVEMETAALYTLARKYKVSALSILTVSDHIVTKEETSSNERAFTFNEMVELALALIAQ